MKRWLAGFCILILSHRSGAAPMWERELREMGYAFLHLSNINVINGLNLSREQADKLRRLAKQVERAGEKPPSLRARTSLRSGAASGKIGWRSES